MSDLIPQPHGGALRPPFTPGRGAAAGRSPMKAIRREVRELMAERAVANALRLQAMIDSDDERVAIIALKEWCEIFYGKDRTVGLGADDAVSNVDLSHLTAEERGELAAAIATIARLTRRVDGEGA